MMNKLLVVALAALVLPACLDEDTGSNRTLDLSTDTPTDTIETAQPGTTHVVKRVDDQPDTSVCAYLPKDDSACAHACEPDVLINYVPEGTCVTFLCDLTNGSQYKTGACNW
ncbi:MAG TPA: hypothetical protein VLB44_16740 [Kofleriaceae bacterium]|nr:hypothetical protein [Kofleriaceae bacterium]